MSARNDANNVKLKRAYEPPTRSDGTRILIDRLWPRGIKKEEAKIDEWMKTISPTTEFENSAVATGTFDIVTSTGVVMTEVPAGSASETPTLGVRTYGTLPPLVPFAHITLINRAKAEAYISLHVDLDGSNTVIEYPVNGTILIQAPLGFYRYVAWVGGREMVGEFRLKKDQDLTIILYKDRIEIK